ncbi:hypothetical protein [Sinomicrobium weinanense]|uniref:DUF3999 family protein n=1 Tax=Sinomicrobium weinanense TaxID=2842200 RepID=A0A926JRG2_9FLAO|nr:hypothetical protein [Sinomicrobium weinanense]MBC9796142.1 hypothetical protein [Sinomicrobium weinanense]MBU3121893.1 hypothetical protein [Sinomicrobium weinanense]
MKRSLNVIVFLFCIQAFNAQEYSGTVATVNEDGIYAVVLSPEIRSASLSDMHTIRILDGEQNEIPYWPYTDTGQGGDSRFITFPIISKTGVDGERSSVIVENREERMLDRMTLKIATTKVSKVYSISGSDDRERWFGLVNRDYLDRLSEPGKTTTEKTFSFPLNNYRYLRWDFDDEKNLPVNVREAGVYEAPGKVKITDLIEIRGAHVETLTDKDNKKTIIHISFAQPQQIDAIKFDTEGPGLFLRKAHFRVKRNRNIKKRTETYIATLRTIELDSQKENRFDGLHIFEKEFTIEIENGDNLPLKNISISFYQHPAYLVAEFQTGKKYRITVDPSLPSPNYDIGHFKSLFRDELPQIEVNHFKKITPEETAETDIPFWKTQAFLWFCILTAAVFISYFSWKLLNDMKK